MSKIGKTPIILPEDVNVEIKKDSVIVKGPSGEIVVSIINGIGVKSKENSILVSLDKEDLDNGVAYWGLVRSLINNAVIGVKTGFSKTLELVGVGYRVEKQGEDLKIMVGYSHPVIVKAPEGIKFELEGNNKIKVLGIDKQLVGQVAANIRKHREPEPYKGKGIKYIDEIIVRKQGKSA